MAYRVAIGPSSFAATEKKPLEILERAGIEVIANPFGRRLTEAEIMAHLQGVDGLIAGLEPLNRQVLTLFPQLRAIARVGIGMDNVDLEAAKEMNIKVSNTPDEQAQGTRVLLIGYGRIGRRVGELLRNFGAVVFVADPFLSDSRLNNGKRQVTLNEGLSEASVVLLHASGKEVILGENEFRKMRDGVIILNAARGELIDEDALIKALTPHISTYTQQCRLNMEMAAVKNLLRDLEITL